MTIAMLLRTKPVSAAAIPVSELRIAMTTGMSAPPMGSTIEAPTASAAAKSSHISNLAVEPLCNQMMSTPITAMAMPSPALTIFWLGKVIGRPEIISWSLRKATRLPVSEIEPMTAPSTIDVTSGRPIPVLCMNSETDTSAAVAPPMPLKMATICGMAVIATRRDMIEETAPPMAIARMIRPILVQSMRPPVSISLLNRVATSAIAIPRPAS